MPLCKKQICYYCSGNVKDSIYTNSCCCLRRKIKYIFYHDLFTYINPTEGEKEIFSFETQFMLFMIPVFGYLIFIARIQYAFFLELNMKNKINQEGESYSYEKNYEKKNKLSTILILMFALYIVLLIPFFILYTDIIIFVLLISLPFKFIPIKLLLGIAFGTFMF